MEKLYFKIFLALSIITLIYPQNDNQDIYVILNEKLRTNLGLQYETENIIDVNKELGLVIPLSEFTYYGIDDPYGTLKDCIIFTAINMDSSFDKNIIGIYKDENILWHSDPIMKGFLSELITTNDLNLDGTVDLVMSWENNNISEIWIFTWDGLNGSCINQKDEGNSIIPISMKSSTISIADIDGDGILEIRSNELSDGSLVWGWNGAAYGNGVNTPHVSFNSFLPAKNAQAKINAAVYSNDSVFVYNYTILSNSQSKRKIEQVYIDTEIENVTGGAPLGWKFHPKNDYFLLGWSWEIGNINNKISPDETRDSFYIKSNKIPGIVQYYIQSEREAPFFNDNTNLELNFSEDIKNNSYISFTIAPINISAPTFLDFLDKLLNYNQRSFSLGWIPNQSTADKYTNYFTTAKTQLQQNNITGVKSTLQSVLQNVDQDSSANLTSEAYALLRYNTEYLLGNLPEEETGFNIKLINSVGNLLTGGSLQYYEGGWKDAINNGDGTFKVVTTQSTVSLRMTYEYASQTVSNVPAQNNSYTFQTVNTAVQLQNSQGNLIDEGTVKYYAGAWRDFGTTVNGVATKELLPNNYSFRMTFAYSSNDKQQNIGDNPTVVFQTVNTAVHLQNSQGILIDQGTVQYYAGAWRNFGTIVNGVATKELLPNNYSFRMTYAYSSNDKQQNIGSNPTVVFQTVNSTVRLQNSQGILIGQGTVQYYADAWRNFGTIVNGVATKELLPNNYSFRMAYAYSSNDKQQNIGSNPTVVFQTVNSTVRLQNNQGSLIDQGIVQYYAGAWRDFGTTANGVAAKELLPNNYSFRMTYEYISNDKQQNIGSDPTVIFSTVLCTIKVSNQQGPLNNADVKYYSGAWRSIGLTTNGEIAKELLPKNITFRASYGSVQQDKTQDVSVNNIVEIVLNTGE